MSDDDLVKAFRAGERANLAGKPRAACPHHPGTAKWDAWHEGWNEEAGPNYVAAPNRKPKG